MPGILDDLEGLQLIGMNADAVLDRRRATRATRPAAIFSYLNLNRAFLELQAGADLLLPAPEPLVADGRRARGSTRARSSPGSSTRPTPRRRCSASRARATSRAALEALDADPELAWMVGDDLEGDVVGAQRHGMRTVLVRTGKFRPDELEEHGHPSRRDRLVDRAAPRVARAEPLTVRVGVDLIEIDRVRRALERHGDGFRERCFTAGRARVLRLEAEPGAALRRPVRGEGGGRQGARRRRPLHVARDRDRRPAEARRAAERPDARSRPSGSARGGSSSR